MFINSVIRKPDKDSIYVSIDSKLEVKAGNYAFWFFSFHLSFHVVHNTEQKWQNVRKLLHKMKYSEYKKVKFWTYKAYRIMSLTGLWKGWIVIVFTV